MVLSVTKPYINIPRLHWHHGDHGGHAVASQTVSEHRGHHGVSVRNVRAILLWQSCDDL